MRKLAPARKEKLARQSRRDASQSIEASSDYICRFCGKGFPDFAWAKLEDRCPGCGCVDKAIRTRLTMTMERFQAIVLKIGNQIMVRHYHWLNYPNAPQMLGIMLGGEHLETVLLRKELMDLGFEQRKDGIWAIERTEK